MSYAIVSKNSKQYKVVEGEEILLDRVDSTDKKTVEFDQVLLVVNGKTVKVGTPEVKGAKIVAEVVGEEKGEKVNVLKYKAKSRYRRQSGHRPVYTRVKVTSIA
jgi:large subunit ribosomal protein L21